MRVMSDCAVGHADLGADRGVLPTAIALLVVPGPSVLFVVSRGVGLGKRAALASVVGNELGTSCHLVAAVAGAGALVQRSATVFMMMKLAGAAYLTHLGVRALQQRRAPTSPNTSNSSPKGTRRMIAEGFAVGVSNPKSTLFFLAVLPQFVVPERGNATVQLIALGAVSFCSRCRPTRSTAWLPGRSATGTSSPSEATASADSAASS